MNIEIIDKWLDEEYGVSYTRLEELHDFVLEQDMKHREEKDKEIDKLNNIINKSKKIYLKELNKCNKNGTYVSKIAVDMYNALEGNK